jgi:hypothetical protein
MADVWIQVLARTDDDRRTLVVVRRGAKMTEEDAIGAEGLSRASRNHVNLRKDAGGRSIGKLGQPERADSGTSAPSPRLDNRGPGRRINNGRR